MKWLLLWVVTCALGTSCAESDPLPALSDMDQCQWDCAPLPEDLSGRCRAGTECGGQCVDLTTDSTNCGACGMACPADTDCLAGVCICVNGFTLCNGTCVNTFTDPRSCGACGTRCGNATPLCFAGTCTDPCTLGFIDCDGDPGNGCEVNANADPGNCGGCGMPCGPDHNFCLNGFCSRCAPVLVDCFGVCVDPSTDPMNCGMCGSICRPPRVCANGRC